MKKVVTILILMVILSCSDDDETNKGCLTGIPKSGGDRTLIKCSTREEYLAGNNTSAGGTASWDAFTGHQWAKCADCK
jgi:hypothetical protein